ncbi:hypothetical protein HK405_011636 [Cladochytrium tenue]|nr:hypothetical protein HK405_011636 [Cladochytrium tenue]
MKVPPAGADVFSTPRSDMGRRDPWANTRQGRSLGIDKREASARPAQFLYMTDDFPPLQSRKGARPSLPTRAAVVTRPTQPSAWGQSQAGPQPIELQGSSAGPIFNPKAPASTIKTVIRLEPRAISGDTLVIEKNEAGTTDRRSPMGDYHQRRAQPPHKIIGATDVNRNLKAKRPTEQGDKDADQSYVEQQKDLRMHPRARLRSQQNPPRAIPASLLVRPWAVPLAHVQYLDLQSAVDPYILEAKARAATAMFSWNHTFGAHSNYYHSMPGDPKATNINPSSFEGERFQMKHDMQDRPLTTEQAGTATSLLECAKRLPEAKDATTEHASTSSTTSSPTVAHPPSAQFESSPFHSYARSEAYLSESLNSTMTSSTGAPCPPCTLTMTTSPVFYGTGQLKCSGLSLSARLDRPRAASATWPEGPPAASNTIASAASSARGSFVSKSARTPTPARADLHISAALAALNLACVAPSPPLSRQPLRSFVGAPGHDAGLRPPHTRSAASAKTGQPPPTERKFAVVRRRARAATLPILLPAAGAYVSSPKTPAYLFTALKPPPPPPLAEVTSWPGACAKPATTTVVAAQPLMLRDHSQMDSAPGAAGAA